jgi:hypothetical protein
MNKSTKTPKMNKKSFKPTDRMSYLYKTTFEDGFVHYGRVNASKGYSNKTYISNLISGYKHNSNNPLRYTMITDFESKVFTETQSLNCEIVFFGTTEDCRKERDRLISITNNCMNSKASSIDTIGKIKKQIVQIKAEYVKILSAIDGTKMYFINMEYGFRRALRENMVTYKKHPLNPNFVQIIGLEIEKI